MHRVTSLVGRALAAAALLAAVPLLGGGSPAPVAAATAQPGPVNAGNTYLWGSPAERWEWEAGESTDPWQIYADGTGRASVYVGMLALDSGPSGRYADTGTVKATLQNAGHVYGRWEARVRGPVFESGHADYTMSLGLVPALAADAHCGGLSVDLGTWTGYQSATSIGVRNGDTDWTATRRLSHNRDNWHTLAVEITPTRISWFLDAKVTATLRNPAAVPGVPLVPQLVLQGQSGVEMNHTKLTADWIRYFSLDRPDHLPVKARAPKPSTVTGAC